MALVLAGVLGLGGCGPKGAVHAAPAPTPTPDAAAVVEPAAPEAAVVDEGADRDRDGVPDATDLCPDQAMVMGSGCTPETMRGCPDDCRRPSMVEP